MGKCGKLLELYSEYWSKNLWILKHEFLNISTPYKFHVQDQPETVNNISICTEKTIFCISTSTSPLQPCKNIILWGGSHFCFLAVKEISEYVETFIFLYRTFYIENV